MHRISPAHTRYEAKAPRTPLRIESATPTIKPISAHLPIALARTGVVFWKHRNRIRPITGNKNASMFRPSTVYPPAGLPAPAPRSRSSVTRPPRPPALCRIDCSISSRFPPLISLSESIVPWLYPSTYFTIYSQKVHKIFIFLAKNDRCQIGCGRFFV